MTIKEWLALPNDQAIKALIRLQPNAYPQGVEPWQLDAARRGGINETVQEEPSQVQDVPNLVCSAQRE